MQYEFLESLCWFPNESIFVLNLATVVYMCSITLHSCNLKPAAAQWQLTELLWEPVSEVGGSAARNHAPIMPQVV